MPNPPQRPKLVPPRAAGTPAPRASPSKHAIEPVADASTTQANGAPPRNEGTPTTDKRKMPASGKVPLASARDTVAEPSSTQPQLGGSPRDSAPPPSDPRHEYRAGEVLANKYRLVRVIGEGGMGAVWLAKNLTLDVDVAVKLIRRERSSPEAAQRLLKEAQAAARLGHPSIVRVFDFGETEHHDPFIVMEVLNGESLRDLLARKKRLTPERAVRTLMPIAGALVSAHSRGIVHRDLKPDNVILIADETGGVVPKIVDFGIAKLHQDALNAVRVTLTGQIMGSPGYMSPEQLDGRTDIDLRTDVWTFTVVLYEAATGQRPFDGAHYNAMLSAILLRDPLPTTELGVGDAALWKILAKGLAKEPKDRWPSMRELGSALAEWALERGIQNDITGASLAAHWVHAHDGPASDAPPADHEVIFSIDEERSTDVSSPELTEMELSPTERPPERGSIRSVTPIPDTMPANTSLVDPTFPPPPKLGGFSASLSTPGAPRPQLPPLAAPRFGPPPKLPSYVPAPLEPLEPAPLRPRAAPASERTRLMGGPLLWIAAIAFVIGIGATWLIHVLTKAPLAAPTAPSASGASTTSLTAAVAPSSAPSIAGASSLAPSDAAPPAGSAAIVGAPSSSSAVSADAFPGPTSIDGVAIPLPGGGPTYTWPPGTFPNPASTLQPRPYPPYSSSGKPWGKPRSSAMPLPSAPNF